MDKKGKGKEKAQTSANVLNVAELADLSIQTAQSIDFLCYEMSEKVEWFLDSGCTDHITPRKSNFIQYKELGQASKKLKSPMGNTSQLMVMEWLLDIA